MVPPAVFPRRGVLPAFVLAGTFFLIGVACFVLGWPEREPWQRGLLSLSGFMYAAAGLVAVIQMAHERGWLSAGASRIATTLRWIVLALVTVGGGLALSGWLVAKDGIVPIGQFLVWTGLAIAFGYLALTSLSKPPIALVLDKDGEEYLDDFLTFEDADESPKNETVPSIVNSPDPDKDVR